jgi:hypothetical protein
LSPQMLALGMAIRLPDVNPSKLKDSAHVSHTGAPLWALCYTA